MSVPLIINQFKTKNSHNTPTPKIMFEAKLLDGSILKRIVEAIKDVVTDVNIDVSPSGKTSF